MSHNSFNSSYPPNWLWGLMCVSTTIGFVGLTSPISSIRQRTISYSSTNDVSLPQQTITQKREAYKSGKSPFYDMVRITVPVSPSIGDFVYILPISPQESNLVNKIELEKDGSYKIH